MDLTKISKIRHYLNPFFSFIFRRDVFTIIAFLMAFLFIFFVLPVDLVFSNTVVTGGDTGSHVYIPYYLKKIFPLIRWWSPDWYSGFPFLYFYPPLMFFITTVLSFIIPMNIAFKLVIFSAVIIFPISAFFTLKWLDLKFPIPQIAAVFSLFLIFLEEYSIYGGNLASLLAGQFSHTMSIALIFMFFGLMYKGAKTGRYHIWNILLGTAVMLTHPISGLILIGASPLFLFQSKNFKSNLIYTFKVYLGIFLLSAFWTLGFLAYRGYSGYMSWAREVNWSELFPAHWAFLVVGAGAGLIVSIIKQKRQMLTLIGLILLCALCYFSVDGSNIWNNRFLPYVSFGILLLAAYFYGTVINWISKRWIEVAVLAAVALLTFSLIDVRKNISFTDSWFKWNFEGYEAKNNWDDANGLFTYLDTLPKGEVLWEYQPDFDKYGTTRVLETVPFFANQPTFEGLLVDSALTSPFHFINQTETTDKPTSAIAGFEYPEFDFEKGVEHMKISGAIYFVAYSENIKELADSQVSLEKLEDTGSFRVYKVKDSYLVNSIEGFSVSLKDDNWLKSAIEWYKGEDLNRPIVFAKNEKEYKKLLTKSQSLSQEDQAFSTPKELKVANDVVEFDVDKIGQPYIIKTTYFPTWKVKGADGPYLISPAYMMVVPTESHVKLYFSYGWVDWLGIIFTTIGVLYLVFFKKINALFSGLLLAFRKKTKR